VTPDQRRIQPRKQPLQVRAELTRQRILTAAAHVFADHGYAAGTTNRIAERARISIGSLYQYFPNKEALIAAVYARHGEQMTLVIQRALIQAMDATLDDALAGLIEASVEAHRIDADLHQLLEQQRGGDDVQTRHAEYVDVMADRIIALLERHRDQIAVPDLKLAAYMLMHAAHGLIHTVVRQRPRGVSLKAATREIVRMMTTYLTSPRSA